MAERFQICFMKPPDFDGALVFREVLFLLRNGLRDLGLACEIHANQVAEGATNIFVGYHLVQFNEQIARCRYIPYQLEQLDAKEGWYSDNARQIMEGAIDVWDFSEINIRFLARKGITARYLPAGYHKSLEIVPQSPVKDVDVLFYGSINERRKLLLEELSEHARVKVLLGVFGADRDAWIARSKIVLNLHYYQTSIMESVRVSYLLNNRAFVVSEESADNPFPQVDLVTAPYDRLIETCRDWLAHPQEIPARAALNYRQFSEQYQMTDLLRKVIG